MARKPTNAMLARQMVFAAWDALGEKDTATTRRKVARRVADAISAAHAVAAGRAVRGCVPIDAAAMAVYGWLNDLDPNDCPISTTNTLAAAVMRGVISGFSDAAITAQAAPPPR